MIPHKNKAGLVEWFEHPDPCGKTMVYTFVNNCGFGNQLFEIAAAYGIAKRTGCHLRWTWNPSTLRKFELEAVGLSLTTPLVAPRLCGLLGQGNVKIVREFERRIRELTTPLFAISSPFQCEGAFIEDTGIINTYFRPNLPPLDLEVPEGETPVGVQVRRTDYVGHGRLDVVTPAYFVNAMEKMREIVENPRFFIVSDDPAWCRREFLNQPDVTVMPPQNSIEGMRTLVACKAHIISNSTFGWWGAWLGESGPVIVPEKWHHKPGSYGDWNPVPERWIRVSVAEEKRVEPIPFEEHERREPKHEQAICIPWHNAGAVWHELRYCLRSIEKHFEDKECPIYILGNIEPPFLLHDQTRVKFIQCITYRQTLVEGLQVADEVLWCNDDTLFVNPTTWDDCRPNYYLRDVGKDFLTNARAGSNLWRAGCIHVLKKVKSLTRRKLRVFCTHVPYVFRRKEVLDVFEKFGLWEKMPVEIAVMHLHPHKTTLLDGQRVQGPEFGEAKFLNFTDPMLTPELKAAIEKEFPDFATWEVVAKF